MNINKEKLSELLSLALDKKAGISIRFGQFHQDNKWKPVTEKEAHDVILQFSEALGVKKVERILGGAGTEHFSIDQEEFYITCSFIPEKEDIKRRRIEQLKQEIAQLENEGVRA